MSSSQEEPQLLLAQPEMANSPWYIEMLAADLVNKLHSHPKLKSTDPARGLLSTLAWGRQYLSRHFLPRHFLRAPSRMHLWLGEQLDELYEHRGSKINVVGPRGSSIEWCS